MSLTNLFNLYISCTSHLSFIPEMAYLAAIHINKIICNSLHLDTLLLPLGLFIFAFFNSFQVVYRYLASQWLHKASVVDKPMKALWT